MMYLPHLVCLLNNGSVVNKYSQVHIWNAALFIFININMLITEVTRPSTSTITVVKSRKLTEDNTKSELSLEEKAKAVEMGLRLELIVDEESEKRYTDIFLVLPCVDYHKYLQCFLKNNFSFRH